MVANAQNIRREHSARPSFIISVDMGVLSLEGRFTIGAYKTHGEYNGYDNDEIVGPIRRVILSYGVRLGNLRCL